MEQKHKLWILVGIPGSGKSTWIQNHKNSFKTPYKIISRDDIRFSFLKNDDDDYFKYEKQVFNEFIKQIKESLQKNKETYVDATHINESSRGKLLRALGLSLKDIEINAIVVQVPINIALKQNAYRTGRKLVPEQAIKQMHSQMTIPTIEEGFDHIYIYKYIEAENKVHVLYYKKE